MKSFNREGGPDRIKLARYARYFGVFLIALSVLAWVTLSKRPGVTDELVAEAVRWAESAPRVPCERRVLFGEPIEGTGSLRALVESGQCGDPRCSALVDAIQHERVCAPERHRSDEWIESVLVHERALERPSDRLRLIMGAMRALDDFRRGEQRAFAMPNDGADLHAAVQRIWVREPPDEDLDELVSAAETLVATSPDATFLIGRNAGEILWVLQRGQHGVSRRYPHPRALTVAIARLGTGLEDCVAPSAPQTPYSCVTTYFGAQPQPEEVPKWRTLLQGPRANGAAWIEGNMRYVGQQLVRHLGTFEQQRAAERVLLAALRIRAAIGCPVGLPHATRALGGTLVSEDRDPHPRARIRLQAADVTFEVTLEVIESQLWIRDALPSARSLAVPLCPAP